MGYSYSKIAAETMGKITKACLVSTNSQNTYKVKGVEYLIEQSRREDYEGSITGSIWKTLPNGLCRKSGWFKINGYDGVVSSGPKFMKMAVK